MNQAGIEFFRNELIPALRSGKYQQTHNLLHDRNGFCCLGVACDLAFPGEWTETRRSNRFEIRGDTMVLPDSLALRFDISANGTDIDIHRAVEDLFPETFASIQQVFPGAVALSYLNDGFVRHREGQANFTPFDFNQIADVLDYACDLAEIRLGLIANE